MTVFEWMAAVVDVFRTQLQRSESNAVKLCLLEAGLIDKHWQPVLRKVPDTGAERMQRHRSKKKHVTFCDEINAENVTRDGAQPVDKSDVTLASPETSQNVTVSSPNVTYVTKQASHVTKTALETSHVTPLNGCHVNGAASVDTYPESSESDSESESDSDQIKIRLQRERESAEREREGKVGAAASRRQRRLPTTFEPSTQLLAWAALNTPLVNFADELAVIRDYEFKNPYSDWPAVVRNWLRKAQREQQDRNAKLGIVPPPVFRDDDDSMDGVFL